MDNRTIEEVRENETKLIDEIKQLEKENKKYKEEKRLILKDIKKWIACAKNEKLERDYIHNQYWDMFETILRKIFTKYNTENISDDDLKYNYYLEKENENLILENKRYKEVIDKLKKYLIDTIPDNLELADYSIKRVKDILKEVEHE